jgi:ubiquinone/menaquinone biosynthesis C-methylase UbiE
VTDGEAWEGFLSSDTEDHLEKVVNRWDETAQARLENPIHGWMDSSIVLEVCVLPKLHGGPGRHWLSAAVERNEISKQGHWLSLGCGAAGTEIAASRWGLFASMLALDASSVSVKIAADDAEKQGVTNIRFGSADLERLDLPAAAFDVILMNMSLHHVRELRRALSQVRRALRPNGFLIVHEFVGPRQFQFTDVQLGLVRDLLAVLPERYRRDSTTGQIKDEYIRRPIEFWNVADPSEAIRSDRIVPELERQFRMIERLDYGGTILHLLLENIVHNFDPADDRDRGVIALLGRIEDVLIRAGVISSDFTLMTLRKRRARLSLDFSSLRGSTADGRRAARAGRERDL